MALYKSNKYKGLYEVEQMEEILKIMKIHGTGPKGNFEPFLSTLRSHLEPQTNIWASLISTLPLYLETFTLVSP